MEEEWTRIISTPDILLPLHFLKKFFTIFGCVQLVNDGAKLTKIILRRSVAAFFRSIAAITLGLVHGIVCSQ